MRWCCLLLVGACWRTEAAPPAAPTYEPHDPPSSTAPQHARDRDLDPDEALIERFIGYKDRICACPDQTCVNGVISELSKWSEEMSKRDPDVEKREDLRERLDPVIKELSQCMIKVSSPPPSPPTP